MAILFVHVCPPSGAALPERLVAGEAPLHRFVVSATTPSGAPLRVDARGVHLARTGTGLDARRACVDLVIDAGRAAEERDSPRSAQRRGPSLATAPDLWLYRGAAPARSRSGVLRTDLPDEVYMSAPWPADASGARRLDTTAFTWLSRVYFGPHPPQRVEAAGTTLEVFVVDPAGGPSPAVVTDFAGRVAQTLAGVTGTFPRPFAQVTLDPVSRSDAVAFGLVLRGGGPGAHLLVHPNASADALSRAWVPTHELSHLFLPFVGARGRFFSEGLATYYQNVLRARAGLISEHEAWAKLHAGFSRGRDAAGRSTPIESSEAMRREHNYSHVYWSGAALFLLLDVHLRTRKAHPSSVDEMMSAIAKCCLSPRRYIDVEALAEHIDAAIGGTDVTRLTRAVGHDAAFPDLAAAYAALGLKAAGHEGDDLTFQAATNPLRRAITGPRP